MQGQLKLDSPTGFHPITSSQSREIGWIMNNFAGASIQQGEGVLAIYVDLL